MVDLPFLLVFILPLLLPTLLLATLLLLTLLFVLEVGEVEGAFVLLDLLILLDLTVLLDLLGVGCFVGVSVGGTLVDGLKVSKPPPSVATVVMMKSPYLEYNSCVSRTRLTPSKANTLECSSVNLSLTDSISELYPFLHEVSKVRTVVVVLPALRYRRNKIVEATASSMWVILTVRSSQSKSASFVNLMRITSSKSSTNVYL